MSFKVLILSLLLAGAGVLAGATIMETKVFPYRYVSAAVGQIDKFYKRTVDPEGYASLSETAAPRIFAETATVGKADRQRTYQSAFFDRPFDIPAFVFFPSEAEGVMLPMMRNHAKLFEGKRVLEIGTGTGIISIYAAKLGATSVVATDISPEAIAAAKANAETQGYGNIVDFRLVPLSDMSAYSVIEDSEQFDVIISNPPYVLDLNAPGNTAAVDNGDLGFSIVRGLSSHLAEDGVAVLYYPSIFYHEMMVRFAEYKGLKVVNHYALGLLPWAAEALFNDYATRLLTAEGEDPKAFQFNHDVDESLNVRFLFNFGVKPTDVEYETLLPDTPDWRYYPGMMAISRE